MIKWTLNDISTLGNYYDIILNWKIKSKTFDEKTSKLLIKTHQNILASINLFSRFYEEYCDKRLSDNIFEEIKNIKKEEQRQESEIFYRIGLTGCIMSICWEPVSNNISQR